jgi:hypothetical protein
MWLWTLESTPFSWALNIGYEDAFLVELGLTSLNWTLLLYFASRGCHSFHLVISGIVNV